MTDQLIRINVKEIDLTDDRFSCSFPKESDVLTQSIRQSGQLNPIVVCRKEEGPTYQVVSGMRRVRSLHRIGADTVLSILVPTPSNGDLDLFLRNLIENSVSRTLSHVEQATAVSRLSERFKIPDQEIVETYLPLIGLNPSWTRFRNLMRVSELSEEVKVFLTKKSLPLGTAVEFGLFSKKDQSKLVTMIEQFRYSSGKIKEMLETLDDVLKREGYSLDQLVSETPFNEIVNDEGLPLPQRASRFREELKKRRNPQRTEIELRIGESFRKLGLSKEIRLSVPSLFEGGKIRVEFEAKDPAHSRKIIDQLNHLPEHPTWIEIFNTI